MGVRNGLTGKWPAEQIERFIQAIASQGRMSYEEFMGLLMVGKESEENLLLWKLFSEFDSERKEYLNLQNIKELLRRPAVARVLGSCEPEKLLREMDQDGNGRVSFDEFRAAMQGRACTTVGGLTQAKPLERTEINAFCSTLGNLPQAKPSEKMDIVSGQHLQYYSDRFHFWIPVVVTKVDRTSGAIQIDAKPDYWFHGRELATKVRHPSTGVAV